MRAIAVRDKHKPIVINESGSRLSRLAHAGGLLALSTVLQCRAPGDIHQPNDSPTL